MAYNRTTSARRVMLAKATSALALATGLMLGTSGTAHAQAFEGNPTVVSGGVGINRTPGTDNIRVDTDQAVINWTTNDTAIGGGVINFLPSGRTAFFRNNPTAQNQFTVLNRIIPNDPSRAIAMNGTIISQLQTGAGLVSGGNVWFYSPGGIVIGATGVIDVGGLLLTSLDPVRDASGNFINAAGSFTLGGAGASPTSYVQIDPGALVQATPENSYIAMVAPIIRQNGVVDVNGSALMVGAEAATITFGSGGLFDIQVTTGTNGDAAAANAAISHTGDTGGPVSTGAGDNHRIYMVAVPKNNAITMAIGGGGSLGFDVAGAANISGNSIILSSGYNVFGNSIDTVTPVNPAQQANISIRDSNITSAINAAASNELQVLALTGNVSFAGRAQLFGANVARVDADGATRTVTFASDLVLSADDSAFAPGEDAVGGQATLRTANSGSISIVGNAFLSAAAFGADNFTSGAVGSGTGGTVNLVNSTGGSLFIGGDLDINVNGLAGISGTTGIASNFGRGGNVGVFALDGNASLRVNGTTTISARGEGGQDHGSVAGTGGAGFGGRVDVFARGLGNTMRFGGAFSADVTGSGGQGTGSGAGGAGTGGRTFISTDGASQIDFLSDLNLFSFGFGGNAGGAAGAVGGAATGGTASLSMGGANGIITVAGDLLMQATANGGQGLVAGTNGGLGTGGTAIIFQDAAAGQITVSGVTIVESLGIGGQGTIAGNGLGGSAQVIAQNTGTLTLSNGLTVDGSGFGGTANTAGVGRSGNGTGSNLAQVVATGGGVINVTGSVTVASNGSVFGSALAGIDGGDGIGGRASISQATGGRITIAGDAFVSAVGTGDINQGGGDGIAGNGTGGDARIAVNDLNITITGNATVNASGRGGNNVGGLRGGTGTGGLANLGAGAGTLSIGGDAVAAADGSGGSTLGTGSGGDGIGGRAVIGSIPGGVIQITGAASASAQGVGGSAFGTGTAGLGDGGEAQLFADNTGSVTVGLTTSLNASGIGGNGLSGASGGNALGGNTSLLAQGSGRITLNGDGFFSAQAVAGGALDGAGNSGAATGGIVDLRSSDVGSLITVNGSILADAIAIGGSVLNGTVGNTVGGSAVLGAISGTFNVTGNVSLDATAFGGEHQGTGNGGIGTGGRAAVVVFGAGNGTIGIGGGLTLSASGVGGNANNGTGGIGTGGLTEFGTINVPGTLVVGGSTSMSTNGFGGNTLTSGTGGNGVGGISRAGINGATLRGGDLNLTSAGIGGAGAGGGAGGNGTGGTGSLIAGSGPVTGLVDFDNVLINVAGFGGAGGAGVNGATGGAGGAGGIGTGGTILLLGTAGNGQLDLLNVQLSADGLGGAGGAGGIGASGAGGNGGAGGAGIGGRADFGTQSGGAALTVNVGFADLSNVSSAAQGRGGTGGNGGTGSTVSGNGGNGGAGNGGDNVLIVRGSRVTAGNITMVVGGTGGDGGTGAVRGNGGNGTGGGLGFAITDRFQIPANRGRLEAANITAISNGVGGAGATAGLNYYSTDNQFEVRNADANVTSFVVNVGGNLPDPVNVLEDFIRISDGVMNVANSFTYITPGQLSAQVTSTGALNASAVGLRAGTFVADAFGLPANTGPGTITASAVSLLSNGDIRVNANIATIHDISILAPGSVDLFNISSGGVIGISGGSLNLGDLNAGNHINLTSTGGSIFAGSVTAANFVAMTAANGLTLGNVSAGSNHIDLLVLAGDLVAGDMTAGNYIALETGNGSIDVGNLTSGAEIELDALGNATFGNVDASVDLGVSASGNITGGNIVTRGLQAGTFFGVGLATQQNIQVGSIQSANNIGAIALGSFTSGALSTGQSAVLLVNGNIQINGGVTTATGADRFFYIGNASMSSLIGGGGGNGGLSGNAPLVGGDPAPVFAAAPVRTLGSLTVTGPIQTGNLVAGLGTSFTAGGAITATGGRVDIIANAINTQAINSTLFTSLNATNGNLAAGNIVAGGAVTLLTTTGTIAAGTLSGSLVNIDGQGAVSIGGVTTTGAAQMRSRAATFTSTGAITAGSVAIGGVGVTLRDVTSQAGQINIDAGAGNLGFGTMTSSANTQFGATGSVTGGDITAGTWIGTNVGGNMTLGNLRTTGPGAAPVSGLSISLGAAGTVTTGAINSFGQMGIGALDASGNFINSGAITTGAITAGGTAVLRANNAITTGAITSTNEIRIRGGSVTTGALQATNAILAAAMTGNLNTGNITTGASALLLASQSVNTGAISTGTTGTTLISNSSAIPATGLITTIDLNALLAATPVRVGGSVSIGGPVTTGTLLSASTGGFSASSTITAGTRISLDVGGTAVFGGLAAAPTIAISSADIAFSQAGGLGNANTGTITLTANRSGSVIIGGSGDSQSQQGSYTLDGSEISRLRAQSIVINAPNVSSTGTGVEVRALTMNGSAATSGINLNGSEGSLTINTPGTIRVNGNAIFNSMASTNRVALNAGRVEINADTGGIFLNGSSPGGVLSISANNIHIASASLLEQLAANVNFTGRDTALSLPIATSRPDGVIQASRLQFNVGSTLLIQNTGTSLLQAGFFGRVGSFEIVPRSSQSTSSLIDLVIYGQLLDTGDLVRNGTSVRDLIFPRSSSSTSQDSGGPSGFTSNSSVNGCLLSAISCSGGGISEQGPTAVVHAGPPPPRPQGEREQQREQEEAEAAAEEAARGEAAPRRPIMPPVTIVNTRRLGVDPIIDEPVTSGGNPNLQLDQALPVTGGQP